MKRSEGNGEEEKETKHNEAASTEVHRFKVFCIVYSAPKFEHQLSYQLYLETVETEPGSFCMQII